MAGLDRRVQATLAIAAAAIFALVAGGWLRAWWLIALGLAGFAVVVGLLQRALRSVAQAPEARTDRPVMDAAPPFRAMLESLADPVMVVAAREADDLAGRRIVFANAAARGLFRTAVEGGLLVTSLRDPLVLEALDRSLFAAMPGEAPFRSGDAQPRVWDAVTRPLSDGAGGTRLAMLLLRDRTDVLRSEQARVDFLANASHELRTPLASLKGFIETLRGHAKHDDDARERFLSIMQAQAERMARLVDDLLSLSRIELNEHIPPSGHADLALTAADVIDALSPLARGRGIELTAELSPRGLAEVVGDRDQLVQVIQNLVENALKYSSEGGSVHVSVFTAESQEQASSPGRPGAFRLSLLTPDRRAGARFAVLRVGDRGLGVARENLPRLTERFYRVEGQKSGARSGTGLGLAIVKHIINRHGGGLVVESAPGEGTMFTVYLPVRGAGPGAVANVS